MASIFDSLSSSDADKVKSAGRRVPVAEGWAPIWQSTPSDKAYIIVEGEVSVRKGAEEIAQLGPGEIFGEASIVGHKLRNATVVTLTDVILLHYTDEQLGQLFNEIPDFKSAVEAVVESRQS